jgi:hypothetical protein
MRPSEKKTNEELRAHNETLESILANVREDNIRLQQVSNKHQLDLTAKAVNA